jgi:2-methylcitrate dehydratase PrpD
MAREFGEFAASLRLDDMPPYVIERVRLVVLHNITVALAGSGRPLPFMGLAKKLPEDPKGATLLVGGQKKPILDAALANSCLMHIRTQDDFFSGANAHLGAVIVPAALALAEMSNAPGSEIVASIVAGYEVMSAISEGFSEKTTPKGFRPTGIFGPFGAAATAARLLRLSPEKVGHAIAISASLAGGLTQAWLEGTLEWNLEVGMACRNGIYAALLAAEGTAGAQAALEGPRGFYHAFAGEQEVPQVATLRMGERWRILETTFKRFPISGISQVPVQTALSLKKKYAIDFRDIERVQLIVNDFELHYPGVNNFGPFGGPGAALMSLQYCVSTALQKGTVVWGDLFEIGDKERLALIQKFKLIGEEKRQPLSCQMLIKTKDGRTIEANGEPAMGLHFKRQEALDLVWSLAEEIPLTANQITEFCNNALGIDQVNSITPLIRCCVVR